MSYFKALEGVAVVAKHYFETTDTREKAEYLRDLGQALASLGVASSLDDPWEDKDDEHTPAIDAAHPLRSGNHARYGRAMDLIRNRYSKYAIVDLVNWLLSRCESE